MRFTKLSSNAFRETTPLELKKFGGSQILLYRQTFIPSQSYRSKQ